MIALWNVYEHQIHVDESKPRLDVWQGEEKEEVGEDVRYADIAVSALQQFVERIISWKDKCKWNLR